MSVHENLEHAEHAQHAAHEGGNNNRKIALIISVLALFLAFSETFGKSAQTAALNYQIEASNLWNFFQAKNIRRTATIVASESAKIEAATAEGPRKAALDKQIDEWSKTAARYRSEPEAANGLGEGTVELSRRAIDMQKDRDLQLNKYHNFEFASAAFQIGIVMASAAVITGMMVLAWAAIGIGLIGAVFVSTGFLMPTFPHDIMHVVEGLFAGHEAAHH